MQYIQRTISRSIMCLCLLAASYQAKAQVLLKNNLLYDATLTPNLRVGVRLSPHWSLGLTGGYRPYSESQYGGGFVAQVDIRHYFWH